MKKATLGLLIVLVTAGMVFAGGKQQGSAGQKQQLTILQHIGEEPSLRWFEYVIKTFQERNPDVNVELQNMGFDSYVTTLQTKIASNDAPDIFATEGEQMRSFYESGYLLNMTGQSFVQNFNSGDLALVTINGEFISVPSGFGSMCVIYNKDIFASAGINKAPETLTEFYDACKALKAKGIAPIAAGYKETWCLMADMQADYIYSVLSKDANAILDLLNRKKTFADSPLWRDVFTRLFERYQYVSSDPFGTDYNTAIDLLSSGKAAMVLNGSWAVSAFRDKSPNANIGIFAVPSSNNPGDSKLIIMSNADGMSIYKNTPNKDAALAFMALYASVEMNSAYVRMTNNVSIVKGAEAPNESAWKDVSAYMAKGQTFSNGAIDHNFPNEYRVAVENVTSKHLLAGAKDVNALLRELDTEFDRIARSGN